jgi:hypothetical protein
VARIITFGKKYKDVRHMDGRKVKVLGKHSVVYIGVKKPKIITARYGKLSNHWKRSKYK